MNAADFIKFMGTQHNQHQEQIYPRCFTVSDDMEADITRSIRRAINSKAPERDVVHNKMLKPDPELVAKLLLQTWKRIYKSREYPRHWTTGLLSPVYKKGERQLPQNYRPLCMLSCTMKVIEAEIAEKLCRKIPIIGLQF